MIYFNDIKMESKVNRKSFSKNLALMISKDYKISSDRAYKMVLLVAKEAKSHVEFLTLLRKKIRE